ncbi:glycosyltransferase family 39 protein, partial [Candidatus Falkowbacteria bacterium]|nr:glycosyltransferase family 39 protein [Candidatus Falkowbacteria bacterium]
LMGLSFWFFSGHLIDSDEGAVLNNAWRIWNHQEMYVDFYEFIAPGAAYLNYYVWKIFEAPNYITSKIFSIIFVYTSLIGLFFTTKIITRKNHLAMAVVFLWLIALNYYPLINYNTYSSLISVWLLYFLISLNKKNNPHLISLSGIFAALAFWFLQTKGFYLLIFFGLYFIFKDKNYQRAAKSLLIFLASFIISFIVLFHQWRLYDLWRNLIILPGQLKYLNLMPLYPFWIFLELAVIVAMLIYAYTAKRKWVWLLAIFQAVLFLSGLNNADLMHFMVNSFPLWVFLVLFIDETVLKEKRPVFGYVILLCLVLLFLGLKIYLMPGSSYNIFSRKQSEIFNLKEFKDVKYIYAGPFLPNFYFELSKPDPFYLSYNNLSFCDPACFNKMLDIFIAVKPKFALLCYEMVDKYHYNKNNPLDNYINQNYKFCGRIEKSCIRLYAKDNCPAIK